MTKSGHADAKKKLFTYAADMYGNESANGWPAWGCGELSFLDGATSRLKDADACDGRRAAPTCRFKETAGLIAEMCSARRTDNENSLRRFEEQCSTCRKEWWGDIERSLTDAPWERRDPRYKDMFASGPEGMVYC